MEILRTKMDGRLVNLHDLQTTQDFPNMEFASKYEMWESLKHE